MKINGTTDVGVVELDIVPVDGDNIILTQYSIFEEMVCFSESVLRVFRIKV